MSKIMFSTMRPGLFADIAVIVSDSRKHGLRGGHVTMEVEGEVISERRGPNGWITEFTAGGRKFRCYGGDAATSPRTVEID